MEKFFRPVIFALAIMLTGSFASCSIDNDDEESTNNKKVLTDLQRKEQVAAMAGNYDGHIYFINDSTMQTDSISCNWQITPTDSTLRMSNFPVSVLAMGVRSTDARKILLNGGVTEFRAMIIPYFNDIIDKGYYTCWLLPVDYMLNFTIDYQGTSHTVKVDFTDLMFSYNTPYYGILEYFDREMQSNILIKDVVVDGTTYTTERITKIYGVK